MSIYIYAHGIVIELIYYDLSSLSLSHFVSCPRYSYDLLCEVVH